MKNITVDKGKIKIYAAVAVIFYILLAVAYCMRGLNGYATTMIPSALVMPVAIFMLGIIKIDIKRKWIKAVLTVFLLLYLPAHLINFVLGDYQIRLAESFICNCTLIFVLVAALMTIFLNLRITAVICCIVCFVILAANVFTISFRGSAITPTDVVALSTALKVAGGYTYFIDLNMVSSVMYAVILLQLISKFCIDEGKLPLAAKLGFRVVFACLAVVCAITGVKNLTPLAGTGDYDAFDTALSNRKVGTIAVFALNLKDSKVDAPDGYSKQEAQSCLDETPKVQHTAAAVQKPNIIVIMNEAFCDIGKVYNVGESEDPLKYWHSLKEDAVSGDMMVSITGGGTSYTEFEFLTGISGGGIIPISRTPYLDFIRSNTHSLAWDLKADGYTNIAMHPFWSSCWNREVVYPFLGFDDFISGEDFSDTEKSSKDYNSITDEHITKHTNFGNDLEYLRTYISDRENYKKIIEQFESKNDGDPLFVFNVTVQNHSGFDYDGEDFTEDVYSTTDSYKELNQYLSLLKQSDIAYGELVDYFKTYDEPTIILMFGDHQPGIRTAAYSDSTNTAEAYQAYAADSLKQKYIVPYKLWANYDIDEAEMPMTSASYLSLLLKDEAGIDYNKWDDFRAEMKTNFDAICYLGYLTDGGTTEYVKGTDTEKDELINKYEMLQYYLLIDKGLT